MARVLIIDDDDNVRHLLRYILEREGYEVGDAQDGREGIRQHRSASADLLIIDLFMPEQEGLETIRELRRDDPAVKIIAISGRGRMGAANFLHVAERFGASRTFEKPFEVQEVLDTVRELLASP
jgi:DNA-binding response OmpR family regulator